MTKSMKSPLPVVLLVIFSMLLSACGGEPAAAPTNTTGVAPTEAAPTEAMAQPTDTTAPAGDEATATTGTGGGGTSGTFDPAAYKKNEIEPNASLRVSSWGDTSEQGVNNDAIKRFNQVYPDVKITYEPQPSDYSTKLLAQISGGSQPDVFYVDPTLSYQLIPNGVLMDLGPALAEVGRSKDDYFPNLIETFIGDDGKIYGLPKDFGALAIFYNTEMVKNPPKANWTQDDFAAFVKENHQGEVFGFSADPDHQRWFAFAIANGAMPVTDGKCTINSDAGVATLEWWYGLYKSGDATIPADAGAGWSGEAFAKKQIASAAQGGWMIPFLDDPKANFGVKYDAVPLPLGKDGGKGDLLFFNAWGASAKSKYPKAAAALALFLASRENEGAILQTGFALPALTGFENDPFFQKDTVQSRISKLIYDTAEYGTPGYYGGAEDGKVNTAFSQATERVFAGQQSPKEALDQACQEVDAVLGGQ